MGHAPKPVPFRALWILRGVTARSKTLQAFLAIDTNMENGPVLHENGLEANFPMPMTQYPVTTRSQEIQTMHICIHLTTYQLFKAFK